MEADPASEAAIETNGHSSADLVPPDVLEHLHDPTYIPDGELPPLPPPFARSATRSAATSAAAASANQDRTSSQTAKNHSPYHSLLATYLGVCRAYKLPRPWDFLKVDHAAGLGPSDPQTAIAALQARHPEEELLASGLLQKNAQGEWCLHPFLATPNVELIVVRDQSAGRYRDLITEKGCVFSRRPPALETLADQFTYKALLPQHYYVLLTEKMVDVILLRALGLAAAPVVGLTDLDDEGIQLLGRHYGVVRTPSQRERDEQDLEDENEDDAGQESAHDPRDPLGTSRMAQNGGARALPPVPDTAYWVRCYNLSREPDNHVNLALVEWSLHSLSSAQPKAIQAARDFLGKLAKFRSLEISEMMQWTPHPHDIAALQFALSRGEARWLKDALADSLYGGLHHLGLEKPSSSSAAPINLVAEYERLHAALCSDQGDARWPERQRELVSRYLNCAERLLTVPILREAEASDDPQRRVLLAQLADLNSAFLSAAAKQRLAHRSARAWGEAEPNSNSSKELLAINSRVVAVIKELGKCKPSPRNKPSRCQRPLTVDLTRRFDNSDLVLQN